MAREFSKRFYKSKRWQHARSVCIYNQNGLCADCLAFGRVTPIDEVHHIKPLSPDNINDERITCAQANLVGLCKEHHVLRHKELKTYKKTLKVYERRVWFDESGQPQRMEDIRGF